MPTKIPIFQVDAFTKTLFAGNPAAVCFLQSWLPDLILQKIAAENNLSETAFLVPLSDGVHDFHLRWFTPIVEVDLCGHATLATAFCVFTQTPFHKPIIRFHTLSGLLTVSQSERGFTLDFPARAYEEMQDTSALEGVMGRKILKGLKSVKTCAVLESPEAVLNFQPDFEKIKAMQPSDGLVITARATGTAYRGLDFVSRYFAPHVGINEDPVTGSAHCLLAPYWGAVLNKTKLSARQISARGGDLDLLLEGGRVHMTGQATLFLVGDIYV